MHDIHRYPNAEETEYIVEAHGIHTSASERAVMVWCYGGAARLAEAGYVRFEDRTGKDLT